MHPLRTCALTLAVVALTVPTIPATVARAAETAAPAPTPISTIAKISPTSGVVPGGSVVTITGRDFTGVTAVSFDSTPAVRFTVVSSTKLTAISPRLDSGSYRLAVTTPAGTTTGATFAVRTFEQEVLRLTNEARSAKRKCGSKTYKAVPALTWDATLAEVAAAHSRDMAAKNYFSHTSKSGASPFDRMKRAGYRYDYAGENIAAGFASPKSVVNGWLKSAGHCRNIMNRNFTELGVGYATGGYYGSYWTQDFGNPR